MKKILLILILIVSAPLLSGCASLLMPYSSNFSCPDTKSGIGDCSSLVSNYKNFLKHGSKTKPIVNNNNCPESLKGNSKLCAEYSGGNVITKQKTSGKTFTSGLISMKDLKLKYFYKSVPSPLRVPSSVKKILIMPFYNANTFYGETNVFVITKKGHWLYGNYIGKILKNNNNLFLIRK